MPPDNPFVGKAGYKPEIFTYGHRNVQGLAVHPETGALWATEHGPQGGDELNLIEAGKNYGWPVITYGREYAAKSSARSPRRKASSSRSRSGRRRRACPAWRSTPVTSSRGGRGQLFLGALAGVGVHRVGINAASRAARRC